MSDKLPITVSMADQNKSIDDFYKNIKASGIKPIDVREDHQEERMYSSTTGLTTGRVTALPSRIRQLCQH